jgi:hypothetical protein
MAANYAGVFLLLGRDGIGEPLQARVGQRRGVYSLGLAKSMAFHETFLRGVLGFI